MNSVSAEAIHLMVFFFWFNFASRTSGTYMVEVKREGLNQEGTEERMVGVDLSKGVILEIQIATGETFARHNLGK